MLLRWKWNRTHTCEKASRPMEQSPFGSVSRALDAVFARPCRGVPFFSAQHDSMWPMTEAGGREWAEEGGPGRPLPPLRPSALRLSSVFSRPAAAAVAAEVAAAASAASAAASAVVSAETVATVVEAIVTAVATVAAMSPAAAEGVSFNAAAASPASSSLVTRAWAAASACRATSNSEAIR